MDGQIKTGKIEIKAKIRDKRDDDKNWKKDRDIRIG